MSDEDCGTTEDGEQNSNFNHILSTWKMFNDTMKPLYLNIENSEPLLESVINFIEDSTQDFCQFFIAPVDTQVNNQNQQKKFDCFTTWLLGHFFYILGCNSLQRLHDKSVSAQLRILNILYTKAPTTFELIVKDYYKCFIQLAQNNSNYHFTKQHIRYFVPDENLSKSINLDLSPIDFNVTKEETSYDLQGHLITIMSTVMPYQIMYNKKDELIKNIYAHLNKTLGDCDIKLKLLVINLYTSLIKASGIKKFNKLSQPNQISILVNSINVILNITFSTYTNSICTNILDFSNVVQHFLEALVELNELDKIAEKNLINLCISIFKSDNVELKDSLKSFAYDFCSKLLRVSTEFNYEDILKSKELQNISIDLNLFLHHTVLEEMKMNVFNINSEITNTINVLSLSPTWASLHFKLLESLQSKHNNRSNLLTASNILNHSIWIDIEFSIWHQDIHINKTPCFCKNNMDIYKDFKNIDLLFSKDDYNPLINEFLNSVERLDCIDSLDLFKSVVEIARNLLLITYKRRLTANAFNHLIGILCSYNIKSVPDIKAHCKPFVYNLFAKEWLQEDRLNIQIFILKALSYLPLQVDMKIKNIIQKILKSCLFCEQQEIRIEALKCLPHLYRYKILPSNVILDLLSRLISTTDYEASVVIDYVLPKLLCICSGNSIIVMKNMHKNNFELELICSKCKTHEEFTREITNGKIFYNEKFDVEPQVFDGIVVNYLNHFKSTNPKIRKALLHILTPIFNHTDIGFQSPNLHIWIDYCGYTDDAIRIDFCGKFRNLVTIVLANEKITKDSKEHIIITLLTKMGNIVKMSFYKNNLVLQKSILNLIQELGLADSKDLLQPCTQLLIQFLMGPQTPYGALAMLFLSKITRHYNLTENFIFHKYKKEFCQQISDLIIFYHCNNFSLGDITFKVTRAFGFKGHRDFFSKEIHHILPCLIPWFIKVPQSQPLLTEIARLVQKGPSTLLSELYFKIYPIIYLNESSTMTSNIMKFITKITHCSERDLKRKDFRMMISELIVHYHSNKEAVIAACENLASIDPDYSKDDDCFVVDGPLSQVIDFLHPRFLGVLGIFGSQLVNSQVADSVKRKVLESLTDLIELMGDKYITPLRFKVMATLRSALSLNVKEYGPLHINAWNAFIRTVNIQSLGSLLSTIFVSLTPLLDHYYTEVNNLFSFLVINHESLLSSFMPDLFFISELNIDENIKMIVHSHIQQVKSDSMIENLKLLLKQVKHEDIEVRQYALQYVTKLLSDNKQELNDAILSSDMMNPVIVELIDALVTGTRESETLKLDYARCLGELGAIEPSHLPRRFEDTSVFTFSATDDTFAISALMELSRALQFEKHTKFMDNFAVAIQEILKFYKISPTEKKAIWESLPESMQEVMLILLSSRYVVQPSMSPDRIHPIFGSSGASTFSKWAFIWVSALIPQIANKDISVLFSSCKPSLNRDLRTLILFLPYIILHVLFGNNDEVNTQIFEEMQRIINIKPHSYKTIQNNKQDKKYLPTIALDPIKKSKPIEEDTHIKCCKTIYVLIDFLERWVREWVHVNCPRVKNPLDNLHYKAIYNFVNKFDKSVLSKGNFECEEYSRALLYLEWYLEENEEKISSYLSDLANIYAKLDEGDAVAGILSIMEHEPSLQDQILFHEVTGQLQDAAACYEIKAQEISLDRDLMLGMIRCYLGLDQPYMAYKLAHSVSMIEDEIGCSITESLAEPLWRLGKWDDLSELLVREEVKESPEWGVRFGHALLSFKNRQRNDFKMELDTMRTNLMCNLTNVTMENGAYQQAYPHIIKLHILNEFESVDSLVHMVTNSKSNVEILKAVHNLLSNWAVRLNILESTGTTVEPVLCARRIFLEQAKVIMADRECIVNNVLDEFIAKSWINSVRLARKAGLYQQAYTYILNAEMYKPKELFVEKAKLLWQKGEQSSAIRALVRGVDEQFPDLNKFKTASSGEIIADRKLCAEAKLLIAIYNDDSVNVGTEENLTNYKTAVDVFKHWEKSLVYLAQYYDKVYSTLGGDETENRFTESPRLIIHFYGNSLYFGCHYIYQSMPRMLSVWLDYVASDKDPSKTTLTKITAMIANFAEKLPTFKFFTAFSQLVSRICHPQPVVYTQLKEILIKIIQRYPQQSLWMILCVYKSSYVQRYKRCAEVLQDPRLNGTDTAKLINDFNILAEKMIDLTNKTIPNGLQETTVAAINRHIQKTFLDPQFSQIMMPVQEFRKMVMPSQEYYDSKRNRNDFNAFPNKMVYITGIQDRVIILASLQKPRRISLKGSDGKNYSLLLKPKDDLRKDFRLMEFNTIVNQYLHKNPVARERRLKIRTYSVLPLNEECGIIEWISNVIPLRPALIKIYKEKQIYTNAEKLKAMWVPKESLDIKRKVFLSFYIKNHPPVFSEWFRLNFPDPHGWYQAKCAYIRTTSVISMVGYILGLGDRHGENILFDSTNGDTMHVDFNCLFNKGLAFEYPERVPFRMTHNMVKAMGPTGVEGMFRKSCEITMNILRAQRETLMSVLRPFVYDPLLSWSSRSNNTSKSVSTERMDKESMRSVENIEKRLKGIVRVRSDQLESTLSCEGQVNYLILEATSIDNLCQMYIGWGPYL